VKAVGILVIICKVKKKKKEEGTVDFQSGRPLRLFIKT
jgi:hypothetical protein